MSEQNTFTLKSFGRVGLPEGLTKEKLVSYLEDLKNISIDAGQAIMRAKANGLNNEGSDLSSARSQADREAKDIINKGLAALGSDIPLLNEEDLGSDKYKINLRGKTYWVIDPLDNSAGFLGKNSGHISVNIALVHDGIPLIGAVYMPETGEIYLGSATQGESRKGQVSITNQGTLNEIHTAPKELTRIEAKSDRNPPTLIASNFIPSYTTAATEWGTVTGVTKVAENESTFNGCKVADGTYDYYPRITGWQYYDIAAMYAVLLGAGGGMAKLDGSPVRLEGYSVPVNVSHGMTPPSKLSPAQINAFQGKVIDMYMGYLSPVKKLDAWKQQVGDATIATEAQSIVDNIRELSATMQTGQPIQTSSIEQLQELFTKVIQRLADQPDSAERKNLVGALENLQCVLRSEGLLKSKKSEIC